MFLQKAWGIRMVLLILLLMFLSLPVRGAGPVALMLGHEW
jgi:hypothetical protein